MFSNKRLVFLHVSPLCALIGRCQAAAAAQGRNTKAKQIQPNQIQSSSNAHTQTHRMTDDQERNTHLNTHLRALLNLIVVDDFSQELFNSQQCYESAET